MNAIYLFFLILVVAAFILSCQNTNPVKDLSDAEIIRLYEKHSGLKINSPDGFCVQKPASFKSVYSIGFFAHDRGCMGNEILVASKIGERNKMTATALELNDWKDKNKQQELALNWTKEVILAWESPLNESNEHFGLDTTPTFEAPSCIADGENWVVTTWVQEPSGMMPQANYYQLQIRFDAAGNITTQNKINSFFVRYNH